MKKLFTLLLSLVILTAAICTIPVNAITELEIISEEILSATTLAINYNGDVKIADGANIAGCTLKITDIYTTNWYFTTPSSWAVGADGKSIILDFTDSTYSYQGINFGIEEGAEWTLKNGEKVNLHDMFTFSKTIKDDSVKFFATFEGCRDAIIPSNSEYSAIPADDTNRFWKNIETDRNEDVSPATTELAIVSGTVTSATTLVINYNGPVKLAEGSAASDFLLKITDIYTTNWYFTSPSAVSVGSDGKSIVLDFSDSLYSYQGVNFGIPESADWKLKDGGKVNLYDMNEYAKTIKDDSVKFFVTNEGAMGAVIPASDEYSPIPTTDVSRYFAFITEVLYNDTPDTEPEITPDTTQDPDTTPVDSPDTADLMLAFAAIAVISVAGFSAVIFKERCVHRKKLFTLK